jgi:hypothetical protein
MHSAGAQCPELADTKIENIEHEEPAEGGEGVKKSFRILKKV